MGDPKCLWCSGSDTLEGGSSAVASKGHNGGQAGRRWELCGQSLGQGSAGEPLVQAPAEGLSQTGLRGVYWSRREKPVSKVLRKQGAG